MSLPQQVRIDVDRIKVRIRGAESRFAKLTREYVELCSINPSNSALGAIREKMLMESEAMIDMAHEVGVVLNRGSKNG